MARDAQPVPPKGRLARRLAVAYLIVLGLSHIVWILRPSPASSDLPLEPDEHRITLSRQLADGPAEGELELVYKDTGPRDDAPTLLMLHGSPGGLQDFWELGRLLSSEARVVAPDLPGFGKSKTDVPDYSVAAHARYVAELCEELELERCHLVAFSMGGGVALELSRLAPERVASISMIAAIGVQELELFGDHDLNHSVHRFQLAAIQSGRFLVPHFGAYDRFPLNHHYARNFLDTDQRRLRPLLEQFEEPFLILHGRDDFLVPVEAAEEHHRIVPQSELVLFETGHFLLWTAMNPGDSGYEGPEALARELVAFVRRVEDGSARVREDAAPQRLAAAARDFDPSVVPPIAGPGLLFAMLLIAAATLLTEDLTCIAVGLVVAQGRIAFLPATFACFAGIFLGDVILYLLGRFVGRAAMDKRPLRWWLTPERIDRASVWFRSRGIAVIFISRFLPGFRVPTYFAAGVLRTSFLRFAAYFAIAVALWTPMLVGLSMWAGREAVEWTESLGVWALPAFALLALAIYFAQSIALPMFSHRGRRLLVGRFRRKLHWEFWPPWIFYVPVAIYVAWLALRHRSLTLFTAANPGIPTGGFIGESKSEILAKLGDATPVAAWTLLRAGDCEAEHRRAVATFRAKHGLPLVLKPDVGQRGSGVRILRTEAALEEALAELEIDCVLQEYVSGLEYGVFWLALPGEERGRIFSITEKVMPTVEGDGERTLEDLILDDDRAVCMATTYLNANATHIMDVPARGETIELVQLGTHCLGAVFLDGERLATSELLWEIEGHARSFEGFWFGRFDVRAESEEAFARGEGFKILELNGVTSEATHIYDARNSLLQAYRVLFEQWRLAFEIGRRNVQRGATRSSVRELAREYRRYRKMQRAHVTTGR